MPLFAGEAVRIRAQAIDPVTKKPLVPAPNRAEVAFWSPTQGDPSRNPGIRSTPAVGPVEMTYRSTENDFVAHQSTGGATPWQPGRWFYRVTIFGDSYLNFEFGSFRLNA